MDEGCALRKDSRRWNLSWGLKRGRICITRGKEVPGHENSMGTSLAVGAHGSVWGTGTGPCVEEKQWTGWHWWVGRPTDL